MTWKDVVGYEGIYVVNKQGQVMSLKRKKLMTPNVGNTGYCRVSLSKNGFYKSTKVHRIVALAFLPNPKNKPGINHINGIKTDNRLTNIEWCNQQENMRHAFDVLKYTRPSGKEASAAKPVIGVHKEEADVVEFHSAIEAQRVMNINAAGISMCCRGKRISAGNYYWNFNN